MASYLQATCIMEISCTPLAKRIAIDTFNKGFRRESSTRVLYKKTSGTSFAYGLHKIWQHPTFLLNDATVIAFKYIHLERHVHSQLPIPSCCCLQLPLKRTHLI